MGGGFPLMLLAGLPQFSDLILGTAAGDQAQVEIVEKSREKIIDNKCTVKSKPKGERLETCKEALQELGAAYQSLTIPDEPDPGEEPVEPENYDQNLEKSLEAYELLLALDPKDRDSRQVLASAYAQQGKYQQALPLYRELVKEQPDPDIVYALAITAQNAGETDEAIEAYQRVIKLAPESSDAETARESIKALKEQEARGGAGAPGGLNIGGGAPGGLNLG
jgi:tetratricopeptide (TPR) repeat protein